MSGAEIMILLVVGIVIVGPKRLPGMMRTAGRWIAKVRRMTMDVRENTGIDKIIREEGLEREIRELQSLTRSPMLRGLSNLGPGGLVSRALSQTALGSVDSSPPFTSPRPTPENPASTASTPSIGASSSAAASAAAASTSSSSAASSAAALIKPAEGNVPRGVDQAMAMLHATGFFSFREREYPTIGCDSYDAMPDDLDDPDAYPLDEPEENEPELAETTTASANGHVASEGAPDANAEPSTVVVASSSESPVVATSETGEPNTEVSLPKPGGSALVPAGGEPETEGKPLDRTDGVETEAARVKKLEASA